MADIIDEDAVAQRPRLTTRATVLVGYAAVNLLLYTGLVVAFHGPTGRVRLVLFLTAAACGVGVVGGLLVAGIKLVRDAATPLWSYTDPATGRRIHGFFAWWGQCAGVWCLVIITGYNMLHLVQIVADAMAWTG